LKLAADTYILIDFADSWSQVGLRLAMRRVQPRRSTLRDSHTAVELDALLGLAGVFGIGEIYLERRLRGAGFLALSAALYTCLIGAAAVPSLTFVWGYLTTAWGLGYLLLLWDIFAVADHVEGMSEPMARSPGTGKESVSPPRLDDWLTGREDKVS